MLSPGAMHLRTFGLEHPVSPAQFTKEALRHLSRRMTYISSVICHAVAGTCEFVSADAMQVPVLRARSTNLHDAAQERKGSRIPLAHFHRKTLQVTGCFWKRTTRFLTLRSATLQQRWAETHSACKEAARGPVAPGAERHAAVNLTTTMGQP